MSDILLLSLCFVLNYLIDICVLTCLTRNCILLSAGICLFKLPVVLINRRLIFIWSFHQHNIYIVYPRKSFYCQLINSNMKKAHLSCISYIYQEKVPHQISHNIFITLIISVKHMKWNYFCHQQEFKASWFITYKCSDTTSKLAKTRHALNINLTCIICSLLSKRHCLVRIRLSVSCKSFVVDMGLKDYIILYFRQLQLIRKHTVRGLYYLDLYQTRNCPNMFVPHNVYVFFV